MSIENLIFREYENFNVPDNFVRLGDRLVYFPQMGRLDRESRSLNVFYNRMCPHCSQIYPHIKEVERALKANGFDLNVYATQMPGESDDGYELLRDYFKITGVPAIFYTRGPVTFEFNVTDELKEGVDPANKAMLIMKFLMNVETDATLKEKIRNALGTMTR